jgi:hypothetical protein
MNASDLPLIRCWFETDASYGIGITAYSKEDAMELLAKDQQLAKEKVLQIIENVDIRTLDQGHVIPNMGPPNFCGIWYPNISL